MFVTEVGSVLILTKVVPTAGQPRLFERPDSSYNIALLWARKGRIISINSPLAVSKWSIYLFRNNK